MNAVEVKNLCKSWGDFALRDRLFKMRFHPAAASDPLGAA